MKISVKGQLGAVGTAYFLTTGCRNLAGCFFY